MGMVCGDIAAVAKLKVTNTGDTLTGSQTNIHFEKVQYPAPMMTYVVRPASKSASSKLKDSLDRILDEVFPQPFPLEGRETKCLRTLIHWL